MQTEHQQRVEKFMKLAKQDVPDKPTLPEVKTRELRARLILEEALETINALGFKVFSVNDVGLNNPIGPKSFRLNVIPDKTLDLVEIIDGCLDISVVNIGTLSACGVKDKLLLEEVDNNNLAKFGPGSYIDEYGKLRKPPNHQPPNIKALLENQINTENKN